MSILDDSLSHLDSSLPSRFSTKPKKSFWSKLTPSQLAGMATFALLLVALPAVVLVNQMRQDNRNKATFNPDGQAVVTARQNPSPFVLNGTPQEIILSVNTNGTTTNGVILAFKVAGTLADTFVQAMSATNVNGQGQTVSTNIEGVNGTQLIGLPVITDNSDGSKTIAFGVTGPNGFGSNLVSTTPLDFAKLKFVPTTAGSMTWTFQPQSQVVDINEDPDNGGTDTLRPIDPMTFSTAGVTDSTNPTLTLSQAVTPSNTPVVTGVTVTLGNPSSTISPTGVTNPTATVSQAITPTNTPIVTGFTPSPSVEVTSGVGICTTISMNFASNDQPNNAPRVGHTVNFVCGQMIGAARYQFRVKEPGIAGFKSLDPVSTNARISMPYTIMTAGDFVAQCRMCTGSADSTCLDWEPVN